MTADATALGRFVDALLQAFEDRRPGVDDATLAGGEAAVRAYFERVFDGERQRLDALVRAEAPHLNEAAQAELAAEFDVYIRGTTLPGYVREATRHLRRERNDFFALPAGLHALERVVATIGGIVLGMLVVRAPFIPLWSRYWVVPSLLAGLFFPELRRWRALSGYEQRLNALVAHAARELGRIDRAYLAGGAVIPELEALEPEAPRAGRRRAQDLEQ
jgi:hypothetical protein